MCFSCFQAEDGIRYLVRSRGLGDVYKRQGLIRQAVQPIEHSLCQEGKQLEQDDARIARRQVGPRRAAALNLEARFLHEPVSYTHLRAHETVLDLVCRLLLEKKNNMNTQQREQDTCDLKRDRAYDKMHKC